jgi:hypothetical protein
MTTEKDMLATDDMPTVSKGYRKHVTMSWPVLANNRPRAPSYSFVAGVGNTAGLTTTC